MFEKGDYIVYGSTGICEVMDITTMEMMDLPGDRKFYVLHPCRQKDGKIFTPVDNQKILMRKILTRQEAEELIEEMPEIEELEPVDDKQREEQYKQCLRSSECREWVRLIKSIYLRNQEREKLGKKLSSIDEKYGKLAQEILHDELSIPLEIPSEDIEEYIRKKMEAKTPCLG